jgi:F-box and WD-40 domain protein CDC4
VSGTRSGLQERGTLCGCSRPEVVRYIQKTHKNQHNMDPPVRPLKRRAPLTQTTNAGPTKYTTAGSPSPFTSNPKSMQGGAETRCPRSSQTVSIGWDENEDSISRSTSRMQIELAECVETKTVTTTTTTKRSYPPILLHHKPLESLDTKEYPLALNPTPPELTRFSYAIDGQLVNFCEEGRGPRTREVRHIHFSTQVKT